MKKQFLILFAFISVLALSQVPQRFNKVIVTGDITSQKYIVTNSNNDSVLLGAGGRKSVESFKTDTVSLSNRINAKAAGSGTAYGTNTGDETLTSIKTKLGAASAVSDGYLKYQDWNTFNSKEPAFSKNTAFNKNFGTTPGTVLEGRTFGTSASSAVGDFIQNQNSSVQSANLWITGNATANQFNGILSYQTYKNTLGDGVISLASYAIRENSSNSLIIDRYDRGGYSWIPTLSFSNIGGAATFVSSITATSFIGSGSNLTGVQLPITLTTNGTSGAATLSGNVLNVPNYGSGAISGEYTPIANGLTNISAVSILYARYVKVGNIYTVSITGTATTTATSPCTFELTTPDASTVGSQNALVVTAIRNTSPPTGATAYSMSGSAGHVTVAIIPGTTGDVTFSISGQVHN